MQQVRHAEDAVERRADLVRDHREEARFRAVGGFRLVARVGQGALGLDPVGDVAADALHLGLRPGAHHDLAPRDPARAVGRRDLLVVHAGAVVMQRGLALLDHRQRERAADELVARAGSQRAEGVVGVGDAVVAVTADDDVALRLEQAARALLGLLELPIAVGELLGATAQLAPLCPQHAQARHHQADGAARGAEERRDADCERVRIVARLLALDRGQEAERRGEAHGHDGGGANEEQQHAAKRQRAQLCQDAEENLHLRRRSPTGRARRLRRGALHFDKSRRNFRRESLPFPCGLRGNAVPAGG